MSDLDPPEARRARFTPAQAALYASLVDAVTEMYGDRLLAIELVGSRAREDARPDSDHDVLVMLMASEPEVDVPRLQAIARRLEAEHALGEVSLSPLTEAQRAGLDARYPGIVRAFDRDAIPLWTAASADP